MYHIILADAEIELIPTELWAHPSVKKHAEKRKKKAKNMLLDASFHHSAMRRYFPAEDVERRGRPDIAHIFSNLVQESALCRSGLLALHIHTRNDLVLHINPKTHLPKAYHRFVGLIESVFHNRYVPSRDEPLIYIERATLGDVLKGLNPAFTAVFKATATSDYETWLSHHRFTKDTNGALVIGGFPHGEFLSDISDINGVEEVRVFHEPYPAYIIAMEVIADLERALGVVAGASWQG